MLKPGSLYEKILVARLNKKEAKAFEILYDFYVARIYRFVYFKVSNQQEAEDLVSQIFLKIWQYAVEGKMKSQESFQAFLYKVARNTVIDHYRAGKNKRQDVALEQAAELAVESSAARDLDAKLARRQMETKLRQLKSEYREVIVLRHINDLSIQEIAGIVDKKPGAVRVLLHRALTALKEIV